MEWFLGLSVCLNIWLAFQWVTTREDAAIDRRTSQFSAVENASHNAVLRVKHARAESVLTQIAEMLEKHREAA